MNEYEIDYNIYRGKSKEIAELAIKIDPNLRLVYGQYYCPIRNKTEMHWWTIDYTGKIYDPTRRQFPSEGQGIYTEIYTNDTIDYN
jgi:hypothetical protein